MTAAGVHRSSPGAAAADGVGRAVALLRLARLHALSRRVPAALGLLAALGALMWVALHGHWSIAGGPAAEQVVPLVIETGAAAVVAVTSEGPFGDQERAAGRWLPWLRLGAAILLTGASVAALSAGATAGGLTGGTLAIARNVAGMAGLGLLSAAVLGGAFAWACPMAYLLITEGALAAGWTTPWVWTARPSNDVGAALCAILALATGTAVITLRGSP
jgi:hypothetical protein